VYIYAPLTVKTGYTFGFSSRFLGIENEIYFEMQLKEEIKRKEG